MNYRVIYSDELYHYGVKGMKWGVRKEYVPKGRDKASGSQTTEKKRKRLTDKQKKIIGAVAATAVIAGTGYVLYKTGTFDKIAQAGKDISKVKVSSPPAPTEAPRISRYFENSFAIDQCHTSKIEDLWLINRDLGISQNGLKAIYKGKLNTLSAADQAAMLTHTRLGDLNNCTYCTTAAEMRRRGFDVVAGKSTSNVDVDRMMGWWKNPVVESVSGYKITKAEDFSLLNGDRTLRESLGKSAKSEVKTISKRLSSMGEGARGNFLVSNGRSGHSVEFEVSNGNVKVFDNQIRMSFNTLSDFFKASNYKPSLSAWMRTDNLDPNLAIMVGQGVIKRR